jgi:hypothetical protein
MLKRDLAMNDLKKILIKRLENKGIGISIIPCFIRDLANSFVVNPNFNYSQINKRLHDLGWNDFDLDYHTLELFIACFEIEGLNNFEYRPAHWFKSFVLSKSD